MDILSLIPSFGSAAFTLVAFVVALSVIVTVHEYGHYIVGRWSGIHSEVFSLGFGPVLFSRKDSRGTRWQIAALPLGGYVRFLGDSNAASGKDEGTLGEMDAKTRRNTMHGAPLWARSATVAAGPLFNFALSILVFAMVALFRGEAVEPPTVGTLVDLPESRLEQGGLRAGDRILALGSVETPDYAAFYEAVDALPIGEVPFYKVEREGETLRVPGPYPFPPLIQTVQPGSAAAQVGLKPGDVILALDGQEVSAFSQLQAVVAESGGRALELTVWRAGETLRFDLTPRRVDLPLADGGFEQRWLIGMTGGLSFDPATRVPGVLGALGYGVDQLFHIIRSSLSGLYHMVIGTISSCNLSGPLGIAESSGAAASQGVVSFIWFIGMLSTAVGLLNLFPIPVLDGGHLVFYAYEAVTGRPPSDKALRMLMGAGLALILTVMVFALSNDIFCP
ncbi:regulator of sigma E protease [Rhodovulum bhavnagarense]|uniref:Zinc metalloprotease n=1 Tax=Rhodovulum bhavnagarense TaxID=992286 RepID=A0A4R2RKE7_9RHOB|nr:RIP metalloprotease RseP [Rhodovulum bhavnagarense]TCP63394.1 regulator of sigma E protease [Rhodovulum bhavnagarense]